MKRTYYGTPVGGRDYLINYYNVAPVSIGTTVRYWLEDHGEKLSMIVGGAVMIISWVIMLKLWADGVI